jgi:predicted acetyltransferase
MAADQFTLRSGTAGDFDDLFLVVQRAFNDDPDDEEREDERQVYEPDRTILVSAGDTLAGTAAAYTRELTVPGGVVPAAHVTMVGVDPTFRRQGVLTRMMTYQLADIRRRGEPVALLWASEGRIYQRFGYGLAARKLALEIEREARLREAPLPGRLRGGTPAELVTELKEIYERVRVERVGWSGRPGIWWDHLLNDIPKRRRGSSMLRAAVHEGPDGPDGYAMWRVRGDWSATGPRGEVMVREVAAATTEAYRSLWQHLLTVDLTRSTSIWIAAIDEPLLFLVDEPRRLGARLGDGLWLRVIDVPAALSARRYAAPVDVVVAIDDPLIPDNSGAWHLVGDATGAKCVRADRPAELHCEVSALATAYLGDASLSTLAAAGRVHELVPGTLAPAATAFGWPRPPSAVEIF